MVVKPKQTMVVQFDPATSRTKTLYSEDGTKPGNHAVEYADISPDGKYLAFYRMACSPWTRFGVWLVDLTTGQAEEITSEDGDAYNHGVVNWKATIACSSSAKTSHAAKTSYTECA